MQPSKQFSLIAHGATLPAIGYGTMELPQRPAELVAFAIASGYRAIDTAQIRHRGARRRGHPRQRHRPERTFCHH